MSFEAMLVEVCDIKRPAATVSTATGRQKRQFEIIASDVPCLLQPSGGSQGKSDMSGWDDPGFVPTYNWRVFMEAGQDVQDGDRVVSAVRGITVEIHSNLNIITPSFTDGHHIELRARQMVHEGP